MKSRGLSLAETVLAVFILVGAMVVFALLMHSMLNYGTRSQQRAMAALAAQKRLEEIREWANTGNNFFSGWPSDGQSTTDPTFPGITLLSEVEDHTLRSPSTELESKSGSPREIVESCKKVRVTASWAQDDGRPLRLVTLMAAPNREPNPQLTLSGVVPASLAPGTSFTQGVTARDTSGNLLHDLFYQWSSLPTGTNPGNGTAVSVTANGSTGRFTNEYQPQNGGPVLTISGTCTMGVIAYYRGRILQGVSGAFLLQP